MSVTGFVSRQFRGQVNRGVRKMKAQYKRYGFKGRVSRRNRR